MPGLAEALTLSSLVAGTLEYAIMVRHREERRRDVSHQQVAAALGQQALMRLKLLERRPARTWEFGTRFR